MKKFFALAALAGLCAAAPLLRAAEAPKEAPKGAPKVVEVRVCPMAGEAVQGDGGGSSTFKNYKVFFCCGGCKPEFAKLSDAEKQKKIDAALKKQDKDKK